MPRSRIAISLPLAFAIYFGCVSGGALANSAPLMISNVKFGLVCGTPDNRRVCFETQVIQVTNESRCMYNHEVIACTWFGFSFDYDAPSDVALDCVVVADKPTDSGNPSGIVARSTSRFTYQLMLKQGSHHFFLAKYISGERSPASVSQNDESCLLDGQVIFSDQLKFEFTTSTAPVPSVPDQNRAP